MLTALLILALVLVVFGATAMVVAAFRGCFFSTLWMCCGGLKSCGELAVGILEAIAKVNE